jgi:hypothetical protein
MATAFNNDEALITPANTLCVDFPGCSGEASRNGLFSLNGIESGNFNRRVGLVETGKSDTIAS